MSKINGIGIGVSYGNSSGTGGLLNSSTFFAPLKTSLILQRGTGDPTWSRATKAWGFNELGYLEEIASGCAFFGGARLVRNLLRYTEDLSNAYWSKLNCTTSAPDAFGLSLIDVPSVAAAFVYKASIPTLANRDVRFASDLKKGTSIDPILRIMDSSLSVPLGRLAIDWSTGTPVVDFITGDVRNVTFTEKGDGIFRVSFTTNSSIYTSIACLVYASNSNAAKNLYAGKMQLVDVTNYDASYIPEYVPVDVEASPYFGAGIDGAKYFETDWQGAPIAAANLLGFRREAAATNNLLHSRDLSNAAWSTKTNITAAKTATGLDGIANTATTLTAIAADAIILQSITLASADRCASAYVKRRTGTGTISFTQDGGSTWTDITAQINGSTWSRVQITSTLANPSVGFKISTSGDAIDVDCVQNEAGAVATSPIVTTTAAVTRNADSLTYQTASNIDFAVGTIYCEAQFASSLTTRRAVLVGPDGYSYINSGDANTLWKAYDGTNIVSKSGLSDISTAKRKRVVSWGTGLKVTGDGISPASGSFDGAFGSGSSMEIGQNINGYIGPVAIYNYQMTDAELQAITS